MLPVTITNIHQAFREIKHFDWSPEIPHPAVETRIRPAIRHGFESGIRGEGGQELGREHFRGDFLGEGLEE